MRLLLINPALPESFWSFLWWIEMLPGKRTINLPLGLATLAGLCPPHWDVTIVDENVQSLPLEPQADLVGVCGMGAQFERQYRFIRDSGIQVAMVGLLSALPRTPLYKRLEREGRLLPHTTQGDNTKPATNILPLRMDYEDMVRRYETLLRRLFRPAAIARRILVKMRYLRRPLPIEQYSRREQVLILWRLLVRGILTGGPVRLFRFLHTLFSVSSGAWLQVITDWIAGLAMRGYVRRHFGADPIRAERLVHKTADWMRRRYAASLPDGLPRVTTVLENGRAELQLILCGHVGRAFPSRAVRRLERMLRCSAATLSLRVEELRADQHDQVRELLKRLAPYGQRVSVWAHRRFWHLLPVDSYSFHLLLDEPNC